MAVSLWVLLQAVPGLLPLLGMAPLLGGWALPLLAALGVAVLLSDALRRLRSRGPAHSLS